MKNFSGQFFSNLDLNKVCQYRNKKLFNVTDNRFFTEEEIANMYYFRINNYYTDLSRKDSKYMLLQRVK